MTILITATNGPRLLSLLAKSGLPLGNLYLRHWPQVEVLEGDPELSARGRRDLGTSLAMYGPKIDKKVREVYPDAE